MISISFVVAMDENRVIGYRGRLPWHLPNDLKRFKALTIGKNILMGRKTFESINKPLPNRHNWVLTKDTNFSRDGVMALHSKDAVLQHGFSDLVVIGGAEIFELFLPECQQIYLTLVHTVVEGDAFFPSFSCFTEVSRKPLANDQRHAYDYSFIEYVKL